MRALQQVKQTETKHGEHLVFHCSPLSQTNIAHAAGAIAARFTCGSLKRKAWAAQFNMENFPRLFVTAEICIQSTRYITILTVSIIIENLPNIVQEIFLCLMLVEENISTRTESAPLTVAILSQRLTRWISA